MPYPVILIEDGSEKLAKIDEPTTKENFWDQSFSARFIVGVAIEDRIHDLEKSGEDVSSLVLPFAKFIMMNCIRDGLPYEHPEGLLAHLKN
jgi:hypothetical protein